MNSQMKRAASACLILLATVLVAAIPSAYAQGPIPMRGFQSDLSSTDDKFLSLDLNGDGKADMLYYRPGGGYAGAYLSHGDGTFHYVTYVDGGKTYNGFGADMGNSADRIVPIDLNGDGKSDFIVYRPGGGYTVRCLSNGDGTVKCDFLSSPGGQYNGFADSMTNGSTRLVTMNRRGSPAEFLVYTPGGGSAAIYVPQAGSNNLQNINLASNSRATTSTGWQDNMTFGDEQIISLDANGDGSPDLLAYSPQAGSVRLYLNNGSNYFTLHTLSSGGNNAGGFTGNSTDTYANAIALDLDGNGKQDFLWWQAGSKTVIGFISNGDGTVRAVNYLTGGTPANGFQDIDNTSRDSAVALDLNGDGTSDFIWYSPGNNVVTAYTSNANGVLTATTYRDGTGKTSNNFANTLSTQYERPLPLNFLGGKASGFVWYVPGAGAFSAYTPQATGAQLNYYGFFASPSTFLSDLSWSIGNVPLKEIVMPGTHDSAMFNLNKPVGLDYGNIFAETQFGLSLEDQLGSGARIFDFRDSYFNVAADGSVTNQDGANAPIYTDPGPSTSGFYLFGHGTATAVTGRSSSDYLNEIENWLVQNPNEVVILVLGQDINSSHQAQYVQMLQNTVHPELIYTQMAACGSMNCTQASALPQNKTIAQLKLKGTRLILINGGIPSYEWPNERTYIGYCNPSGAFTPEAEFDCFFNANFGGGDKILPQARAQYQAADADSQFLHISAALTPYGALRPGQAPPDPLYGPIELATFGPNGYNDGTNPYDFNQLLMAGTFSGYALNMITLDAMGGPIVPLIISQNHQTWVDTHFFNNNFDQPAGALSIGANGDIWASGTGHSISVFKVVNGAWKALINSQPNVKKLAVDLQGGVWLLDSSKQLIHYDQNGANMQNSGHQGNDVAVGADGSVWYIGLDGTLEENSGPTNGQPDIYNGMPSQVGTHVAIDNMGRPWVIDNNGYIQKFNGTSWQQVNGAQGNEIVAGKDGSIFITGYNTPSVARYNVQNNNFDFLQMDARHIAVEPGGQPWAIRNGTGVIYKGSLDQI